MAKGGIRFGAGRPRERRTVESALAFDVRSLQRDGCLTPGTKFQMSWSWQQWQGARTASIGVAVSEHELTLNYAADAIPHEQRIHIDYTPCHFGGVRAWLLCPHCARRQAVLYFGRHRFACRSCNNLAYRTQQLDLVDRSWRKQRKIEAKMGGENALFKPKGMHETTWQRLRAELSECEDMRLHGLYQSMLAVSRRFPDFGPISTPNGPLDLG